MELFFSLYFAIFFWLAQSSYQSSKHFQIAKNYSELADSACQIIMHLTSKDVTTTNIISSGDSSNSADFKTELLSRSSQQLLSEVVFRQEVASNIVTINGRRKRFTIFIIQTFDQFSTIAGKITSTQFWFNGFYLIVLTGGKIPEFEQIFKLLWSLQIYNVNIIYEEAMQGVSVTSFIPFSSKICGNTKPVQVDKFHDGKFVNSVENLFPDKMKNLHNCPIRVSTSNGSRPAVFAELSPNGTYELSGRDINLVSTLSKYLNFKIEFTFVGHQGFLYENGSAYGPMRSLLDDEADLSVANWLLKLNRLSFVHSTDSYFNEPIIFIIPTGRELTAFEKLVFPFTYPVWILVSACLLIGCLVIHVISHQKKIFQNFVFGSNVKNPVLNLFNAFIGGSQKVLPKRNFARFLLMMFLMYSLVVRTLYQGLFFHLLQSNKKHGKVQSIDEMVKKDFKFYVYSVEADLFQGIEAIQSR